MIHLPLRSQGSLSLVNVLEASQSLGSIKIGFPSALPVTCTRVPVRVTQGLGTDIPR